MHRHLFLIWLGFLICVSGRVDAIDLLIRNGRVIDGSGKPAVVADVAIENGRIAAVGRLTNDAATVIDAGGRVVAPGFIDVHTHAEDILERPNAENFVRMGVTTLMLGNCGSSVTNVGKFFKQLEEQGNTVNVGTLIGHGTLREAAMGGSFDRIPTEAEMSTMKQAVEQGMKEGAFGLSTGLIYLPGTFAKTEEIIELAKIAATHDGIYTSHMRSESSEIDEALAELIRIAREAHVRAEVSHIKLSGGKANWGRAKEVLETIDRARADGLDVTQDMYVYTASSTGLAQLIPESWREGDRLGENLRDDQRRVRIFSEMKDLLKKRQHPDYGYVMIADYKRDPGLNGLKVPDAARKVFGKATIENQIKLILTVQTNGGATAVFHGIDERDLRVFLKHTNTMIGCDSGVRAWNVGVPHPRGYGNNARLLSRYVQQLHLLRWEEAVRRMTSLPASTFRIKDRGVLSPGAWADLVIFDPRKVQEHATFEDPHHYATGFSYVMVNGTVVVKDDVHTGARPGKPLRHGS